MHLGSPSSQFGRMAAKSTRLSTCLSIRESFTRSLARTAKYVLRVFALTSKNRLIQSEKEKTKTNKRRRAKHSVVVRVKPHQKGWEFIKLESPQPAAKTSKPRVVHVAGQASRLALRPAVSSHRLADAPRLCCRHCAPAPLACLNSARHALGGQADYRYGCRGTLGARGSLPSVGPGGSGNGHRPDGRGSGQSFGRRRKPVW